MKYFGTDGIRTNDFKLLDEISKKIAFGLNQIGAKTIIVGKDTRLSGNKIEKTLIKNLTLNGINVFNLKVVPSSCVSLYTKNFNADFGIVITASHNPSDVNGLKFFCKTGEKLEKKIELELEKYIDDFEKLNHVTNKIKKGFIKVIKPLDYKKLLKENAPQIKDKIIVLDCANGASKKIAPQIFNKISKKTIVINRGSGKNINKNCGAVHPEKLSETVIKNNADFGFAFDGDADRCVCVLKTGEILSGDNILFALAKSLKVKEVVGTIYCNGSLDKSLQKKGIVLHRSDVGDQEVKSLMNKKMCTFGGERSGHFIFSDIMPTGDGILTALKICSYADFEKQCKFKKMPSVTVNLKTTNKQHDLQLLTLLKNESESLLGSNGRIILRASGTEDLIRILVEHKDIKIAEKIAEILKNAHTKEK